MTAVIILTFTGECFFCVQNSKNLVLLPFVLIQLLKYFRSQDIFFPLIDEENLLPSGDLHV